MKSGALYRGDHCVVPRVWRAANPWHRARGLLGREPLAPDAAEGMLIEPCAGVHTFWMGYALDLVFLDATGRVLGVCGNLAPWRARTHRGAHKTLELRAGSLAVLRPQPGDQLTWRAP